MPQSRVSKIGKKITGSRSPKKRQALARAVPQRWRGVSVLVLPARIAPTKVKLIRERLSEQGAQVITKIAQYTAESQSTDRDGDGDSRRSGGIHVVTEVKNKEDLVMALRTVGYLAAQSSSYHGDTQLPRLVFHPLSWITSALAAQSRPQLYPEGVHEYSRTEDNLSTYLAQCSSSTATATTSNDDTTANATTTDGSRTRARSSSSASPSPDQGKRRRLDSPDSPERDPDVIATGFRPDSPIGAGPGHHPTSSPLSSPAHSHYPRGLVPASSSPPHHPPAAAGGLSAVDTGVNHNQALTDALQVILDDYKARGHQPWRIKAYGHAINALKRAPQIHSGSEAQQLDGIGDRMANKIDEILRTGKLHQAEEVKGSEESAVLQTFIKVWGAGPKAANSWYRKGFRTLAQLRADPRGAGLTKQQELGLLYYDEINTRISREEVALVEAVVREEVQKVRPGCEVQVAGSYRRGRATCGDIDILITHPKQPQGILAPLLHRLHAINLLTDDLSNGEGRSHMDNPNKASSGQGMSRSGGADSYQGVYLLQHEGSSRIHHRIDIKVYTKEEYPFALLYFTGSAYFNRTMRLWAQKRQLHLSDHGLLTQPVYMGQVRTAAGDPIPCESEEDIFKALDLEYVPPHDRDV